MPTNYTSAENQHSSTMLLREAIVKVGYPNVSRLLPTPFILWCHDVTHYSIQLTEDGQETVIAWRGCAWAKDGLLGLNPEVDFCRDALETFFAAVEKLYVDTQVNDVANQEQQKIAAQAKHQSTIQYYRSMFQNFELRP